MRANTQNVQQGEQETRGAGDGRKKQWGTEILGDRWKGEGWGQQGTWGQQDGHYRDFQVLTRQGLSGSYTTGTFRKESKEFEGGEFGLD